PTSPLDALDSTRQPVDLDAQAAGCRADRRAVSGAAPATKNRRAAGSSQLLEFIGRGDRI
ncbi:MAG TPA: hypothetical protein VFJ04_03915, partial [Rhodanobacteraceae bacterium]|nr:hypothetical protein [Rhodanobacteraceae bacterium]